MTKKHEELVGEIGQIVTESIGALLAPSTDEEYSRVKREVAKRLITLTLSAVRDGLELPDELGRGKGYADTKGYDSGFAGQKDVELEIDEHTVRRSQVYDGDRLEFIALRKEGTGKEE